MSTVANTVITCNGGQHHHVEHIAAQDARYRQVRLAEVQRTVARLGGDEFTGQRVSP